MALTGLLHKLQLTLYLYDCEHYYFAEICTCRLYVNICTVVEISYVKKIGTLYLTRERLWNKKVPLRSIPSLPVRPYITLPSFSSYLLPFHPVFTFSSLPFPPHRTSLFSPFFPPLLLYSWGGTHPKIQLGGWREHCISTPSASVPSTDICYV